MLAELSAVSPYNHIPALRRHMRVPSRVTICDCTLREGEQSAHVALGIDAKLAIARRLAALGVPQIQVGYPGRSAIDRATIKALKREGLALLVEAVVQVFQEDWREQIDLGLDSGADVLGLIHPSSRQRLVHVQAIDHGQMLERSIAAVEYAAGQKTGTTLKFAPTDTLRADFGLLQKLYPAVERAGAHRVSVADTTGSAHPSAIRYLVRRVTKLTRLPVQVHCHDDFGLATACSLAGAEAGGSILDVTVLGIGERAGSPALEEVAVALAGLYGCTTGIHLEDLCSAVSEIAALLGIVIPTQKSVVGDDAFAHKLDAHVRGVLLHSSAYEALPPALVGNTRRLPLGKHSGPAAVGAALSALRVQATAEQIRHLADRVEALSIEQKKAVSETQFRRLLDDLPVT